MRTGLIRLVAMWVGAIGLAASAQPMVDRVPSDAIIYVGWTGTDSPPPGYKESHFQAIAESSDLSAVWGRLLPAVVQNLAQGNSKTGRFLPELIGLSPSFWKYPGGFYLHYPNTAGGMQMPRAVLISQAGKHVDVFIKELEKLNGKVGDESFRYSFSKKDDLVQVVLESTLLLPTSASPAKASFLNSYLPFMAIKGRVVRSPWLVFYYNNLEAVKAIDNTFQIRRDQEQMNRWAATRDGLGLAGLKQAIFSCGFEEKKWTYQIFIDAPSPRKGLLSLLDQGAASDALLELIPRTASSAQACRFSLKKLLAVVRDVVGQFDPLTLKILDQTLEETSQKLGVKLQDEIINGLGNEWAWYCDRGVGGNGYLGTLWVNRLSNPAQVEQALARLMDPASKLVGQVPPNGKTDPPAHTVKAGGVTVHYLPTPMGSPAWAVKDGCLYMAMYPQIVMAALDRAASTVAKDSILKNLEFNRTRLAIGGGNAMWVSYLDLPQVAGEGYQNILATTQMYLGLAGLLDVPSAGMAVPPIHTILPHLSVSSGFCSVDPAGLSARMIEPFPGSFLLASQQNSPALQQAAWLWTGVNIPSWAHFGMSGTGDTPDGADADVAPAAPDIPQTRSSPKAKSAEPAAAKPEDQSSKAVSINWTTVSGKRITNESLQGKITIIDFWATWCGPCMAEAGHMVKLNKEYRNKGVQIIGVSLDQDIQTMKKIASEKGFDWPQVCDGKGWDNTVAQDWGVNSIPRTFILSPEGVVIWSGHPGDIDRHLSKIVADADL